MPKGVYKRTEEYKEKLRGIIPKSAFKKGHVMPVETREKIGKTMKGRRLAPFSSERKKNMSIARKGIKLTMEHKKRIGERHMGKPSGALNKHWKVKDTSAYSRRWTDKEKARMRGWMITHPNRKYRDTGIELRVEQELIKRNINYQKQVPLCKVAIVDFYLPEYRIIIQCDGDYWHNKPGAKEKDEKQDAVLTFNGFNVYRFWEHEINESVENCINKISSFFIGK